MWQLILHSTHVSFVYLVERSSFLLKVNRSHVIENLSQSFATENSVVNIVSLPLDVQTLLYNNLTRDCWLDSSGK
jgi:hypothetical protein